MKSNFLKSTDHLKSKFSLKLKTDTVTRSYAHDFGKKFPQNGGIFVIVRKAHCMINMIGCLQ